MAGGEAAQAHPSDHQGHVRWVWGAHFSPGGFSDSKRLLFDFETWDYFQGNHIISLFFFFILPKDDVAQCKACNPARRHSFVFCTFSFKLLFFLRAQLSPRAGGGSWGPSESWGSAGPTARAELTLPLNLGCSRAVQGAFTCQPDHRLKSGKKRLWLIKKMQANKSLQGWRIF